MPSILLLAAVILMTLFANIYYNHQCLVFMPVIGFYHLVSSRSGTYTFYWVFLLALHDSLLTSEIAITVT